MDIETYNQTHNLPGGPIVLASPIIDEDTFERPITPGVLIGRLLGLAVVMGLGFFTYLLF